MSQGNPMARLRIDKVTVNISVGRSGEALEKAEKILRQLTGQTPTHGHAKKTVKDFGIRRGEPIACIVTLRGEKAMDFLKRAFHAVGNKIPAASFDRFGNFAFGIKEHIELPGTKYDPELGITGMDVCVSVSRPGYRVKERKRARGRIGSRHRTTRAEAAQLLKEMFGVEVVG